MVLRARIIPCGNKYNTSSPIFFPVFSRWENQDTSRLERGQRKAVTVVCALTLVCVAGIIIGTLKWISMEMKNLIPTTDTCLEDIPWVYRAVKKYGASVSLKFMNQNETAVAGLGQCQQDHHWISYEDAPIHWQHTAHNRTCTAPCVKYVGGDDPDLKCGAQDGGIFEYSKSDIVACYCMQHWTTLTLPICSQFRVMFARVHGLSVLGPLVVILVNQLLKSILRALGDFEHHTTRTL